MIKIDSIIKSLHDNSFIDSVFYEKKLNSTNEYISSEEIPANSIVITDEQTSGKGRAGKKWISEKNTSLTFSIKKKFNIPPSENHSIIRFFSFCVYEAVLKLMKDINKVDINSLKIKWPNDILYGNKKLCGILIESRLPSDLYIIGIGINCNQLNFPPELNAISLRQIAGNEIDINSLLISILDIIETNKNLLIIENSLNLYLKWKMCTNIIGKNCNFTNTNGSINSGKITDLNYDGSISILFNGKIEKFYAGELKITSFN